MSRIVVTTLGSLGDLHPYLAIARGLQARGHQVVVATDERYREKIEKLGLDFARIKIDFDWIGDPEIVRQMRSWGLERIIRRVLLPALRQTYENTLAAADGADILVSMQGNYASRLVGEKKHIPWVSAVHFPIGFFSAHDPPVLPPFPVLSRRLHPLGPRFWKPVRFLAGQAARLWTGSWHRLRAEIGLPPDHITSPLINAQSPLLHLALFSKLLSDKQQDWPPQTVITGFPWYDHEEDVLPEEVQRFLDAGPAPIFFTLGTTVSKDAVEREFFEHSAAAIASLGQRAILQIEESHNRPRQLGDNILALKRVPLGQLLPRTAVIVHHGGISTSALAMRSGRPMLVVPCAWDQHDNAARLVRLGVARSIPRHRYNTARATAELRHLLDNPNYARRAAEVGAEVRREDGVLAACNAISR